MCASNSSRVLIIFAASRASSMSTFTPSEKFGDHSNGVSDSVAARVTSCKESYQPVVPTTMFTPACVQV